ncbi:DNA adenine methylase [Weissella sp. MSCH1]|uniref:DNA adenine methylase n=1 Tax=Weissella sp. MSCH1 TaxID=3383343 RepID=UPI0038968A88
MKNNVILKPLFKYPGGKSSEYKYFKKFFPTFSNYVEPFLGGGAVFWATEADRWIVNDYSSELMSVYIYTQEQDPIFLNYIKDIADIWELKVAIAGEIEQILTTSLSNEEVTDFNIYNALYEGVDWLSDRQGLLDNEILNSTKRKIKSLLRVSKNAEIKNLYENALGVIGSAIYTDLRSIYNITAFSKNPQLKTALYLFLREYSYSSMFRYNASGEFNVPFGGNSYSKKKFFDRYIQMTDLKVINKLAHTELLVGDFADALIDEEDTFIFLDPPYDSEFSTYNLHIFDAAEQRRLHASLVGIKKSKWMMVIKSTPFIEELYGDKNLFLNKFDKNYSVNFKNRNDQKVEHLIITNYKLENVKNGDN